MEASRDEEWDGYPPLVDIQTRDEPPRGSEASQRLRTEAAPTSQYFSIGPAIEHAAACPDTAATAMPSHSKLRVCRQTTIAMCPSQVPSICLDWCS